MVALECVMLMSVIKLAGRQTVRSRDYKMSIIEYEVLLRRMLQEFAEINMHTSMSVIVDLYCDQILRFDGTLLNAVWPAFVARTASTARRWRLQKATMKQPLLWIEFLTSNLTVLYTI
jgi:hypothetical protein